MLLHPSYYSSIKHNMLLHIHVHAYCVHKHLTLKDMILICSKILIENYYGM